MFDQKIMAGRIIVVIFMVFVLLLVIFAFFTPSHAEIVLDGSFGQTGPVPGNPGYTITEDMGKLKGNNLFHSFSRFNIYNGESATFTGPDTVQNIISRVTGGESSWIDGALRSQIQGADLYLLNPWGVMFGPNARLDITGSFHVSTADYLRLGESGRFDATWPQNSLLTTAPPSAFGFLDDTPADVSIQGSFIKVPENESVFIIGGDITINDGTVYAPNGRINVVGVASAGEVTLGASCPGVDTFESLGTIDVSHTTAGHVKIDDKEIGNIDVSGAKGGAVFIRGGCFTLDHGYIFSDNGETDSDGGTDIRIQEETSLINGACISSCPTESRDGGDVLLETGSLNLTDGSQINITSYGAGDGGQLSIYARESVSISGYREDSSGNKFSGGLFSRAKGEGEAGNIYLDVGTLTLTDRAQIDVSSFGNDNGGNLTVIARESISLFGFATGFSSEARGVGDAGDIYLDIETMNLMDGAKILNGSRGVGDGGLLNISVKESISISGYETGFYSDSWDIGDAGDIFVDVGNLILKDKAQISTSSRGTGDGGILNVNVRESVYLSGPSSGFLSATLDEGKGGDIFLNVGSLDLTDGAVISTSSEGIGDGGQINLAAGESVSLSNFSAFFGDAFGEGNAGGIILDVGSLILKDGSQISTRTTGKGEGGLLNIKAGESVSISGFLVNFSGILQSGLFSIADGEGHGGNIQLQARQFQLSNRGLISAESSGNGNAGSINIDVADTFCTENVTITTEAKNADGGNIDINAGYKVQLAGSDITATVSGGAGDGGNITIDPVYVILNNSTITANAEGGKGGNITIVAKVFLASPDSILSASSRLGIDGEVVIDSPVIDISGTLAALPESFMDVGILLPKPCAERGDEETGSFVIAGRSGLPQEPDSLLSRP